MRISHFLILATAGARAAETLRLNITAIGAANMESTLECWQVDNPFELSGVPGVLGIATVLLGEASNVSVAVIPAGYDSGLHNGPANQWLAYLSGYVRFTLPTDDNASAHVFGGEFGLVFEADTAAVSTQGHQARFPGDTETVVLVIPTTDGLIPEHIVLHDGECTSEDIQGLRGLAFGLA